MSPCLYKGPFPMLNKSTGTPRICVYNIHNDIMQTPDLLCWQLSFKNIPINCVWRRFHVCLCPHVPVHIRPWAWAWMCVRECGWTCVCAYIMCVMQKNLYSSMVVCPHVLLSSKYILIVMIFFLPVLLYVFNIVWHFEWKATKNENHSCLTWTSSLWQCFCVRVFFKRVFPQLSWF